MAELLHDTVTTAAPKRWYSHFTLESTSSGIVLLIQKGKLGLLFVVVRLVSILVLMMSPGTGPTMQYALPGTLFSLIIYKYIFT